MEILIYKTNLSSNKKVRYIKSVLNNHPDIITWTVDREDIDNVMRIEALSTINESDIINLMKRYGVYCRDLPD